MKNGKIIDRNYGSIPHLSTSKLDQQADKKISAGQEEILTKKTRDWKDLIIVTEKIDGSNVGIVKKSGQLIPVTRPGYRAETSPYSQHHYFANYVYNNKDNFDFLPDDYRIVGEWCICSHGTLYDITDESAFCAFDIIDDKNKRIPYIDFLKICVYHNVATVPLIHIGQPITVHNAIKLLGDGFYGKPDKPEGIVYKVERNGTVDFMAKHVRYDKEDGKYLDSDVWNIGYEKYID